MLAIAAASIFAIAFLLNATSTVTDVVFASQHVAHFSLERLPAEESAGVDYVSTARLREYCSPACLRWRCLRGNEGLRPAHAHNRERLCRRLRAVALGR
jgi:hypothetical protein